MIVLITSRGHGYTLKSILKGTFGFPTPLLSVTTYDKLLGARRFAKATYIFSDLERLPPFELRLAAELYRAMRAAGLRCLNDPAKVKARLSMLQALHRAGINPFNAYRADEYPRPQRFPVFVRFESDHGVPLSELIHSQDELDATLATIEGKGIPLRGTIVVEFCAASDASGRFSKWGAFRVGREITVDHVAVEKNWLVKYGKWDELTDEIVDEEHRAVSLNQFSPHLEQAFDLACIEFGRADYAIVDGATVIYEINTNPYIGPYVRDPKPQRAETQIIARTRFGNALKAIDTSEEGHVSIELSPLLRKCRRWRFGWLLPKYP